MPADATKRDAGWHVQQRFTSRVFDTRPPFSGGSTSVTPLLRIANEVCCISNLCRPISELLHAVEAAHRLLPQGPATHG